MKKIIIIGIFVFITVIGSIFTILFFDYQKQEMIQTNKTEQIRIEQKNKEKAEEDKQFNLNTCMNTAKNNRKGLWDANADKNGSVEQSTIKWIDDRYNNEVKTCIERYK